MTTHPSSPPTSSPRSGPTSGCARGRARPSCSSRSSRAGSGATRSSAAARGSSTSRRRRRCGEPVVGYLAYDHAAKLEPTVPLPDDGPGLPESRFVVADTLVRFDHVRGHGRGAPRRPGRGRRAARTGRCPRSRPVATGAADDTRAHPRAGASTSAACARAKEHIRAGDAFQIVLSQRAERPTSALALDLYRSLRRVNPSPYLFLLELDGLALIGSSPETLVKVERPPRRAEPDRGHDAARATGDAERLLASEKDRAEHVMLVDLGRNDLSRVCAAGHGRRSSGSSSRSASRTSRTSSREVAGELRDGRPPVRPAARLLPGRHRLRRAEGAGDADHLRARGLPARARTPARSATRCPAARSTRASRSGRSSSRDGVAHLQAGAGIVADSDPAAEHEECLRSSPRSRRRSSSRRREQRDPAVDNYD